MAGKALIFCFFSFILFLDSVGLRLGEANNKLMHGMWRRALEARKYTQVRWLNPHIVEVTTCGRKFTASPERVAAMGIYVPNGPPPVENRTGYGVSFCPGMYHKQVFFNP